MPETAQPQKVNAPVDQITLGPVVRALLDSSLAPLFWRATRIGASSAWWSHVPFAHWLVVATAPRVLVELGTHTGVSYSAFCEAVRLGGLATQCHAVDTWRGDLHTGKYGDQVFDEFRGFHDAHFARFSTLLRCTFDEALEKIADRSVDLLHIDGLHTYDAVRHDFESWLPKLSDSAVVLLHDTNERGGDFGVWRLWGELCRQYPSFEFLHGHGLGLLAIGSRPPAAIVDLCSLSSTEAATLRAHFAALGEHWSAETSFWSGEADRRLQLETIASELASARATLGDVSAQAQTFESERSEFRMQAEAARAETAQVRAEAQAQVERANVQAQARVERAKVEAEAEIERSRLDLLAQIEQTKAEANRTVDEVRRNAEVLAERAAADTDGALRLASSQTRRAETAEAAAASATARAATIEASTIWRASRPLRAGLEPFPGLRRNARRVLQAAWWTVTLQLHRRLPLTPRLYRQRMAVAASPLFDRAWYLQQNPDVAAAGVDAALHYVKAGAFEGRSPSPLFDTAYYLRHNPDVAQARKNALLHYLEVGAAEGRNPNPYFDTAYYLREYPDVERDGTNPLVHFLLFGNSDGRNPGKGFDVRGYLASRPDVAAAGVNALVHYLEHGRHEIDDGRLEPPSSNRPGVAVSEASVTPSVVKLGEPISVRGWCGSEGPGVSAVVLRSKEGDDFEIEIPLEPVVTAASSPAPFEATLAFDVPGTKRMTLGLRLVDGVVVDQLSLPPVTVADDGYCEAMRRHLPTNRVFSVLFLDGIGRTFQSPRYRIDHMREALAAKGISSAVTDAVALSGDVSSLRRHDVLVLFRAGWDRRLEAIVKCAREWNIPVIFDVDDYVFEPSIATKELIDGIRTWSDAAVEQYRHGVRVYRRTLEEADCFTGSTDYLVARAQELGRPAHVINNHLDQRLVALSADARTTAQKSDGIEIIYLSGTATHQRDFGGVVPALVDVLTVRPQARLRVVGLLDLEEYPELEPFSSRILKDTLLPWDELPASVASAHIAIAPLETGNPFCEAKSELKYFESAACGLAVVASPTDPFRRAIVDGETGFLCETVDEWRDRLLQLIDDDALRTRMAEAGRRHALERFGPEHAAEQATETYRKVIADWRRVHGIRDSTLAINWIMVDAFAGSGGHNDIFIAANEMAKRGHHVTLFFEGRESEGNSREIRRFVEKHFGYQVEFEIALGFDNITHCDALIATHNSTAHVAHRMRDRACVPAYFVQDYEPFFSPVNSEYFAAEQTYRYGLFTITLGPWLKDVLEREHGVQARNIDFWVNRRYYYAAAAERRRLRNRPRVLYFARPHMPRRCYELGLAALSIVSRNMTDIEICLFGASEFPGHLDFPYTPLGVLTPPQLAELYRGGDLGLAFSTTNPSLVTFEMMACGLPLVDLDVFDSRERHGGYPALLTDPLPEAVAEGVMRLARTPDLMDTLGRQGIEFTKSMPEAHEALADVSRILEEEIGARDHGRFERL